MQWWNTSLFGDSNFMYLWTRHRLRTYLRNKQAGVERTWLWRSLRVMIISKAFIDTPHYDTARVAAQVVSGISFIIQGIILHAWKTREWTTTASKTGPQPGLVAIGGGFWFLRFPLCAAIVSSSKNWLINQSCKETTLKLNIYCEIQTRTIVQSIYNSLPLQRLINRFESKRANSMAKIRILIRIHNDEEIIIESEKLHSRNGKSKVVIKRVKLRTGNAAKNR